MIEPTRVQVTQEAFQKECRLMESNVPAHMAEYGDGAFVSPQEILGMVTEQFNKLASSVQAVDDADPKNPDVTGYMQHRLRQFVMGLIFASASVTATTLPQVTAKPAA